MSINRLPPGCRNEDEEGVWAAGGDKLDWQAAFIGRRRPKGKIEPFSPDWDKQLATALDRASELAGAATQHTQRVVQLEQEVRSIRDLCEKLREHQAVVVPITTFAPEPFDLIREIPAVVQPDDDSFVATFFDANVNASGDTQQDAVANLKSMMLDLFEALQKEKKLGKSMTRKLAVLQSFIGRKE